MAGGRLFTSHDDTILREEIGRGAGWAERAVRVLDRPLSSVEKRARILVARGEVSADLYRARTPFGRRDGLWSGEERVRCRKMVAQGKSVETIATALGRTPKAVRNKIHQMGVSVPIRPRTWQKWEVDLMELLIQEGMSQKEIARRIGKTEGAVKAKCQRCGFGTVRGWTAREDLMLRQLWAMGIRRDVIAARLGRTANAVHGRAIKIGATGPPTDYHRAWTSEDDATLRQYYEGGESIDATAHALDRSAKAIQVRGSRLRLDRSRRSTW